MAHRGVGFRLVSLGLLLLQRCLLAGGQLGFALVNNHGVLRGARTAVRADLLVEEKLLLNVKTMPSSGCAGC